MNKICLICGLEYPANRRPTNRKTCGKECSGILTKLTHCKARKAWNKANPDKVLAHGATAKNKIGKKELAARARKYYAAKKLKKLLTPVQ